MTDARKLVKEAWAKAADYIGEGDMDKYLNSLEQTLGVSDRQAVLLDIVEIPISGSLIPSPSNPIVNFFLPAPEVCISFKESMLHTIRITYYVPVKEQMEGQIEAALIVRIVLHELMHLYFSLEYIRRTRPTKPDGTYLVQTNDDAVYTEETLAEGLSLLILSDEYTPHLCQQLLSYSYYAVDSDTVLSLVMSLRSTNDIRQKVSEVCQNKVLMRKDC